MTNGKAKITHSLRNNFDGTYNVTVSFDGKVVASLYNVGDIIANMLPGLARDMYAYGYANGLAEKLHYE